MNAPEDLTNNARQKFASINGWIDLKNYAEATEELNRLEPSLKSTIHFLKAWIRIYSGTKAWTNVEMMCSTLLSNFPGDSFGIRHVAEALHRQRKHVDAISKLGELLSNEDRRETASIRYDLARYFCEAGQLKEARECLRGAIERDPSIRKKALEDADLKNLWTELQG